MSEFLKKVDYDFACPYCKVLLKVIKLTESLCTRTVCPECNNTIIYREVKKYELESE
jgi:uncharacterized protein YbaR (Trm112 family)